MFFNLQGPILSRHELELPLADGESDRRMDLVEVHVSQVDHVIGDHLYNPATRSAYQATQHPLPLIQIPASAIKQQYKTWQSVPSSVSQTFDTPNGKVWFELRALRADHLLDWYALVAIPEGDVMGPIVASRKGVVATCYFVGRCGRDVDVGRGDVRACYYADSEAYGDHGTSNLNGLLRTERWISRGYVHITYAK
ncbi:uncharacterized protein EV422DRAFT_281319 [Fimicolochytrium jonesii]|uniref:uncharacterized protein n=1 Tax=Fimicolochytrium jonesii TaxID=1396493 RepID=UPI0022FF00DB|nr:uncharacterized protein EV422DRAFT_281319 [Fimicolochytrium jonesii]KAI8816627.1 hypothetical protein EV422DRAFT_281319 [Fimicolochytrium jonesii]